MATPLVRTTGAALLATAGLLASTAAPAASTAVPVLRHASVSTVGAGSSPVSVAARSRIAAKMEARIKSPVLGANTAGYVIDAKTGRRIWSRRAQVGMLPASVTKLATALAALDVLGPDHTVTTRVVQGSAPYRLVLVGGGDALLSSWDLGRLAAATATSVKARGIPRVTVLVDDSLFPKPTMPYGWKSGYYPVTVAPVRALVADQRSSYDTSLQAGRIFASALAARGVAVAAVSRAVRLPGTREIASVESRPVSEWVDRMLLVSDNDIAENLARVTALKAGRPASWAGARAVRSRVLAKYGVSSSAANLYDGSGLSRANRMTGAGVVAILKAAHGSPRLAGVLTGLPVAARTGSLRTSRGRFSSWPSACAAGRVTGKTGMLRGSITLAGTARTADGGEAIYVLMENGRPSTQDVKRAVDGLAATITGCW